MWRILNHVVDCMGTFCVLTTGRATLSCDVPFSWINLVLYASGLKKKLRLNL